MHQSSTIFNFHDLFLVLTTMLCLLFTCLLISLKSNNRRSNYLLAAVMLAFGCLPIHKLILFGEAIKPWTLHSNPDLFFIFSVAYWVEGPLLYFFTLSIVERSYRFKWKDAVHALPALCVIIFYYITYHRFPADQQRQLIESYAILTNSFFIFINFLQFALILGYITASLIKLKSHNRNIRHTFSNISDVDLRWLSVVLLSFFITRCFRVVAFTISVFAISPPIANITGLLSLYAEFVLVCFVIFTSLRYMPSLEKFGDQFATEHSTRNEKINPAYVARLNAYMQSKKPYLDPELTLDQLAEQLHISPRALSTIINRQFKQNFFEYINSHRIEEAKEMLADVKNVGNAITSIFLSVGFNSRSAFNTFFKKSVGKTPSQYRREHRQSTSKLAV